MNALTMEQLREMEEQCINPQDAIIAQLLIEGVEVHEIVYLKNDSLDPVHKVLTVTDASKQKRYQTVSQRCVDLYQKALKQTHYIFHNCIPAKVIGLKQTDFLIKASLEDYAAHESAMHEMDSVIYQTIFNRLRVLGLGRFIFR